MQRFSLRLTALVVSLGLGLAVAPTRADFVGSFGLNANLPVSSPASNLATATSFSFANHTSNGITSGGFNGMPIGTTFTGSATNLTTPIVLSTTASTGYTFTNSVYGTFTQTAAAVLISQGFNGSVVTNEAFRIIGIYTGAPGQISPLVSSVTISFTQNGGPGTAISASGTVNVPATSVPEPASLVMLGLGMLTAGGWRLRGRLAR